MSAVIIPFPAHAPSRADIAFGLDLARRNPGLAETPEKRAYFTGYFAGFTAGAMKADTKAGGKK